MIFAPDLLLWLLFCLTGLATAVLSLRLAQLSAYATRVRHSETVVFDDAQHWRNDQVLLVAGWCVFLGAGLYAMSPSPVAIPQGNALHSLIRGWLIIVVAGVWAFKTAIDYWHTRSVWRRPLHAPPDPMLQGISDTGAETLTRVKRVETTVVNSESQAAVLADVAATTEERLSKLEERDT